MVFSSIAFLFYFLPIVLLVYFAAPSKGKNYVLLASGILFYFYGEQLLVLLMLFTALWDYGCARVIEAARHKRYVPKIALTASILMDVGILCYFKYTDFFLQNLGALLGTAMPTLGIALPIGISFYTFQSMSYVIDVYRGRVCAQRNPFAYATYLTLFPQLIAGPIVRFETVQAELVSRHHSIDGFSAGALRFVVGLSKKVLIANVLGEFCAGFSGIADKTVALMWMYAIAYSLQIYFDFSGYSDMAIGLGRLFGFSFEENFDYPYLSQSVTEFWRRWHISLGRWFRDYLYIPLGGNRKGRVRWLVSVVTVWFVTGLWHGAGWNFILWGLYFAVFLMAEKFFLHELLHRLPRVFSHVYTLIVVAAGFVLFSCTDNLGGLADGVSHLGAMFGAGGLPLWSASTHYYVRDYAVVLALGAIGSTPLLKTLYRRLCQKKTVFAALSPLALAVLLLLCVGELSDATFNPFLYFNF